MASAPHSLLNRQVRKVRQRLVIQVCINRLIVGWVIACAVFAVWILAKPYALGITKPWVDWAVGGSVFVAATLAAIGLAFRKAPSPVDAALSLDQRFNLRERVTTSLTMRPDEQMSPAGQALLADAEQKLGAVNVGQKFPVRFGWNAVLVPAAGIALGLLIYFYDPVVPQKQIHAAENPPVPSEVAKVLEQKKKEYLQKQKAAQKPEQKLKSKEVEAIEAKIEEILKKPMTTEKDLKDRLSELTAAEEQLRNKEKEESEKVNGFQDQMKKMNDQLQKKSKTGKDDKDGLAKDLKDQLGKGDLEKAKEEAERLSKKIKDGDKINKKDKEQLANELKDMKDELKQLARDQEKEDERKRKEKEEDLKKKEKEGKIDKEELDREMNKLKKEQSQTAKEMTDLADKLERAEQALNQGKDGEAAEALGDAAKQLDDMAQREQNLDDIDGQLQRMQDLRESMGKACDKCKGGNGSEDDAEELHRNSEDGDKDGNKDGKGGKGSKKGGKGGGHRPENKSGDSGSVDAKQRAPFDKKGTKIHVGTADGKSIIGKTGAQIDGEVKQAAQDAPDAIEVQRIPRGYKDSAKGYFKNIGGQQTGDPVPKK